MLQEQLILLKRSINIYNTETEAWAALDNLTHTQGQPVVAFFRRNSDTHGDTALGAIFAIGTANGVGKYKACSSHDDMLAVAQALNTHISEWTAFKATFDKMFEYDTNHEAIKAKLDFYTDSNKNISAGGLGGSGSSSLGALYQLIDVMINSTGDGVEGAAEGSVLAYDATAGKWKAIAQSEILPNMSDYYTKDETDAAINAIPIYSMAKLSASDIASLSDGANVREAYRLKKGGNNVDDTVIKIYKDSAIKSLELRDNKYLVLTYTDNEGNEQSISKDLSVIVNDNYVDLINNQEIGGIKTFTEKTIFKKDINVLGDGIFGGEVVAIAGDAEPAGVTNYAQLQGKPSINGKELASGNNTLDELGIQPKGDYTTASQLDTTLADYAKKVYVSNNYATKAAVNTIQALIPTTASATNQLADKDFVNSSIATATAEFRGSFTSLDELKATSGNLNDYAFYLHKDSVGNSIVDRYKWTTAGWLYEYTLNNSSFTAAQWAALNSAITATLVQSYNSHLNNSTIHITANERIAWNAKWDYDENTIKAVKVNSALSADSADTLTSNAGTSAIPIYFDGGIPVQCTPSSLFYAFANGYDASAGGRVLGITIAGQTRKVVVAYSTLAGSADKLATARTLWGKPFDGSANVDGDLKDVGNITASGKATIQGDIISGGEVAAIVGEGTPAGVTDYSALTGKPSINGVTLVSGNNTLAALGIQAVGDYATNSGVETLLADYATKVFVSNNYAGKSAFNSHTADTDIHITSAERAAWNAKWNYDEATIKAVKVTSASSADSVAWSGISGKPTTFTPSAHTHTASDVSGLPTSLKNPNALTFGSKSYDGSAAATITASDLGALTSITKSMVEGVLTGNITSHTHSYLPLSGGTLTSANPPLYINRINGYSTILYQVDGITVGVLGFNEDGTLITRPNFQSNANYYNIIHSDNYNSYAPTLTGTGASGTWGISISGNAASAAKLQDNTAYTAWGQTFFENGKPKNVSGDLKDVGNITASGKATIQGDIISGGEVVAIAGEGTPAGVTDYSALTGKPAINGVTLVSGNNTLASLGIQAAGDYATNSGVAALLADYATKVFVSNNYVGKTVFNSHTADTDIHITSSERTAWNAKWDYNENTIKAVKVTSASSADSVAWSGIKDKPTTFTPSAHTHTASEVSGLPTSLKNPYALTFGSKSYDGSAAATITASDLGALTSITKSMVEGVLTGNITSHTHSYLPLNGGTLTSANPPLYINRINGISSILYQVDGITVGILGFNQNGDLITRPNFQSNTNYYKVLHSDNYNSYAPTLTGTGASGTWGISITGNAATATKLQTPRNIYGQNFDGTKDIDGYIKVNVKSSPDTIADYIGLRLHRSIASSDNYGVALMLSAYQNKGIMITGSELGGLISYYDGTSNNGLISFSHTGNVSIGTTTDNGYKLQVNGSERVYGDLIVDGEVSALVA